MTWPSVSPSSASSLWWVDLGSLLIALLIDIGIIPRCCGNTGSA
jgi:hypothetical protein